MKDPTLQLHAQRTFSNLIQDGREPASEHAGPVKFQTFEKELSQLRG